MPLEILYLVVACSGVYDTFAKWVVAAFPTLEDANAYRALASEASEAAIAAYKRSPEGRGRHYVYFDAPTKYDLAHSVRDTKVTYQVEPLPLVTGAMGSLGLMAMADAFASAQAVTRELNYPGIAQKMGKAPPLPAVEVKSDFADKLKAALV